MFDAMDWYALIRTDFLLCACIRAAAGCCLVCLFGLSLFVMTLHLTCFDMQALSMN